MVSRQHQVRTIQAVQNVLHRLQQFQVRGVLYQVPRDQDDIRPDAGVQTLNGIRQKVIHERIAAGSIPVAVKIRKNG